MTGDDKLIDNLLMDIEKAITDKEWALTDILDLDRSVYALANELNNKHDMNTKVAYIGNENALNGFEGRLVPDPGELNIRQLIKIMFKVKVGECIKMSLNDQFKTAKVVFDMSKDPDFPFIEEKKEEKKEEGKFQTIKEEIKKNAKKLDEKEMKDMGLI